MPTSGQSRRLILQLAAASLLTGIAIAAADAPDSPGIAAPASTPFGTWLAEDIVGGGVIANARTTLTIAPDGSVSGNGGCNSYGGSATIDGDAITFGPLAATRMACEEAVMRQETTFFQALDRVASFRVGADGKLLLLDDAGELMVRLAAD